MVISQGLGQGEGWGSVRATKDADLAPVQNVPVPDLQALWPQLQAWASELGFSQIGVADVDLQAAEPGMTAWLAAGFQGDMAYMAAHGLKRARPADLLPGTLRVITARMDYLPASAAPASTGDWQALVFDRLADPQQAVVSLYAQGRDYHKVL